MAVRKILCVRFSSIGDIVLTTPVLRCLKQQIGGEIHFLTKTQFASILDSNHFVDRVITVANHINEVLPLLKSEQYDWIADMHHNLRTLQVKSALRVPGKSFPKLKCGKMDVRTVRY